MTDNNDLRKRTQQLVKDLNYFIIHIIVYFVVNVVVVITIFENIQQNWWLFFPLTVWAIVLILHSLRVYGIRIFGKNKPKMLA